MTPDPVAPAPQRKWLVAGLLILALSGWAAALFVYMRAPKPTPDGPGATVVFHISRIPPAIFPGQAASDPNEFESYRQAQAAMIRRRLTLNQALKDEKVANLSVVRKQNDPLAWLHDNLRVSFDSSQEFMRVEIDGKDEGEYIVLLRALATAYLQDVEERDRGAQRARLAKLEDVHRSYRSETEKSHHRLDVIAAALGAKDRTTLAVLDSLHRDELRTATRDLQTLQEQLALFSADSPEAKNVRTRIEVAKTRLESVQNQISRSNEYRMESEDIRRTIQNTERLGQSIANEIEKIKINLGAPPRVTVVEEAFIRPRR
ncbi:Capsular exopolysaccharide biosynthesis protein OS=Singulisphaera acidiphila (strain ATCC BAA-1392 / DSM 18658 / VKM B-2454 / MOB10) GN=Sinac_5456 PE=4 SV=1 [Gemmata massiliana]|uniref:Capsular exopolysaccharide biosynthesis protein n=1 Tax=Gemmata massiliana TaxID=1210884 RepID=A0A6P2CQF3_9BACT|nr:hypothetical protein [Gemmata massiliana]VTR90797.1 Capsular exopolysaccharide biosynthesis protein OS=Singulisphaera acidiphila (strain ATCC BAA-1392 / DSM 18658 / VKM B-2454 / MOB10) GN=Sinac_5456 PE=4 SV=1 [Gemmata massiliana]